jgi:predicted amidohydrolase YtcJ
MSRRAGSRVRLFARYSIAASKWGRARIRASSEAGGELILPGEQIGRKDALRLYTAANAWFNFEENDLGSIEVGKLADLVVLDRPYLDISDEEIKQIESLLTIVGGRVVHAGAPYAALKQ